MIDTTTLYRVSAKNKVNDSPNHIQWKRIIVAVYVLLSLVAHQVIVMKTSGATNNEIVGLMTTLIF